MSKLITIYSRDRVSGTPTDFIVNLDTPVNVGSIFVKGISFPNNVYNVRAPHNIFTYNQSGTPASVTVTEGNYTFTELVAALTTVLDTALSATTAITLTPITNKINIDYGTASVQTLNEADGNEMANILGIITSDTADNTTYDATGIPKLYGLQRGYLLSKTLAQGFNAISSNNQNIPLLIDFPITEGFGSIVHFESDDFKANLKVYRNVQNIQNIDIRIVDEDGDNFEIHGGDVVVVLKVYPSTQIDKLI